MASQLALVGVVTLLSLQTAPCSGFLIPSFLEFGECGTPPPQPNFDPIKFSGTWYSVLWIPNEYIPLTSCINSNYTMQGDHMLCREKGLDADGAKQSRHTFLDFEDDPTTTFSARGEGLRPTAPLTVISTDYTNYACLYSCMQTFGMKAEFAWIMSRHPRLDKKSVDFCKKALTRDSDIDLTQLEFLQQGESCPYWTKLPENWKRGDYSITANDITQLSTEVEDRRKAAGRGDDVSSLKEEEEEEVVAATSAMQDLLYYEPVSGAGVMTSPSTSAIITITSTVYLLTSLLSTIH